MKVAIVGGALQGMESVYLSKKAGFETFVIDRRAEAPAIRLSDDHAVLDPMSETKKAERLFGDCDKVLPACENEDLLRLLDRMLGKSGKLLFDIDSYLLSSSKTRSNAVMEKAGIPLPGKWPECGFPVVVKPSSQSGSIGVTVANSEKEMNAGLDIIKGLGDEPVVQEFVSGKSVSIEVVGDGKDFRPFVTTEVILSGNYDCKRVKCSPDTLSREREEEFRSIARRIAESIGLRALMDVEAIDTEKGLRVLEIDARIPSQTPAAVLAATGVNLVEEMIGRSGRAAKRNASSYEHFVVTGGKLYTCGEKEFARVRSPRIEKGLFGSDEMISDHAAGAETWRGTMINSAGTDAELEKKRARCIRSIMAECGLKEFVDASPERI
jgi:pyrrolysine biosynthesis protein PylC